MKHIPRVPAVSEMKITTDRLNLDPIRIEDAGSMFRVLDDPALHEFTGGSPPSSVEELVRLYEWRESWRPADGFELRYNWAIRQTGGNEPVGYVQTSIHLTHADVAWVVGTPWQRRGFASEAAAALVRWLSGIGVREVRAYIHPLHTGSQRVAFNAGLSRTSGVKDGEDIWILEI